MNATADIENPKIRKQFQNVSLSRPTICRIRSLLVILRTDDDVHKKQSIT